MTTRATRLNWILTGAATAATLLAFGATANAQDADTAQRPNLTSRAERSAERLDRRGNAIENRLDRRGDRANRRLDRKGDRRVSRAERRAGQ